MNEQAARKRSIRRAVITLAVAAALYQALR